MIRVTQPGRPVPFFGGVTPELHGTGSGFIIDSNGNIVTNYHVINRAAAVEVILKDGRVFSGQFVGGDRATDVALVKIDGTNLPVAKLGDSEKLKVGQFALAIGNALGLEGAPTVSTGVISAIGRPLPGADLIFEGLIQSDAAINPGNSGGPLADLDGNVIGMNTAMVQFAQGLGFAIPVNHIKWVIEQILEKGKIVRPMLGVLVANLNPAIITRFNLRVDHGAFVTRVSPNGPAQKAGIRAGDVITKIGEHPVKDSKDLILALSKLQIGKEHAIKVQRGEKGFEVRIKLVEAPE